MFLMQAAGNIETEDPALTFALIIANEHGHCSQSLESRHHVHADHDGEALRLALDGKRFSLDFLVMLEFRLEEADKFESDSHHTGHTDTRELVGREDLLYITLRDH